MDTFFNLIKKSVSLNCPPHSTVSSDTSHNILSDQLDKKTRAGCKTNTKQRIVRQK